jgi:hypothetical protein
MVADRRAIGDERFESKAGRKAGDHAGGPGGGQKEWRCTEMMQQGADRRES